MSTQKTLLKLPAAFAAGSFLCMVALAMFTNPLSNISYAMFFFAAFIIFLVALGYLTILTHKEEVSYKSRLRITIISIFITLLVMFRSAGALGWVDAGVLCLITVGLLFYVSRRA